MPHLRLIFICLVLVFSPILLNSCSPQIPESGIVRIQTPQTPEIAQEKLEKICRPVHIIQFEGADGHTYAQCSRESHDK